MLVRNFVTRVTKFVIYVSKFVTNLSWQTVKTITGLGKIFLRIAKNICLELRSGEAVRRAFQGILELNSTEGFALQTIQH